MDNERGNMMTDRQELNLWIAEHIFNAKIYVSGRGSVHAILNFDSENERDLIVVAIHPFDSQTFNPVEDSAAAMQVLEKCAEHGSWPEFTYLTRVKPIGHWVWYWNGTEYTAPTLPLAICTYAKQLFRK